MNDHEFIQALVFRLQFDQNETCNCHHCRFCRELRDASRNQIAGTNVSGPAKETGAAAESCPAYGSTPGGAQRVAIGQVPASRP